MGKNLLKNIFRLVLCCTLAASLSSCGAIKRAAVEKIHQIKVTSFHIESIQPHGLRSIDAEFTVTIDNPTVKIELKDITVSLRLDDKYLAYVTVDPITLPARQESVHHPKVNLNIGQNSSTMELMSVFLASELPSNLVVNVSAVGVGANVVKQYIDKDFTVQEIMALME